MRRLRPAALPLALPCLASLANAAETAEKAAKIDKLMSQYADYGVFSGTVLVSVHDQVIFKKGYGQATASGTSPIPPK